MLEINDNFYLEDELDKDDELEITGGNGLSGEITIYINREKAKQIVNHLTKVFKLENDNDDAESNS